MDFTMLRFIFKKWLVAALGISIAGAALGQNPAPDYLLGAGDDIRIQVFQNPELTVETRVPETGVIAYPLIGNLTLVASVSPALSAQLQMHSCAENSFEILK